MFKRFIVTALFASSLLLSALPSAQGADTKVPPPSLMALRLEDAMHKNNELIKSFREIAVDADANEVVVYLDALQPYLEEKLNLFGDSYIAGQHFEADGFTPAFSDEMIALELREDKLSADRIKLDALRDEAILETSHYVDEKCGNENGQCLFEKTFQQFVEVVYSPIMFRDH